MYPTISKSLRKREGHYAAAVQTLGRSQNLTSKKGSARAEVIYWRKQINVAKLLAVHNVLSTQHGVCKNYNLTA